MKRSFAFAPLLLFANLASLAQKDSTKIQKGVQEEPLSAIVSVLGYKTNVGWTTLNHHLKSELQGDELKPTLFKKVEDAKVELIPLARYFPDSPLSVGYYSVSERGPVQHHVGILSKRKALERQPLPPLLAQEKSAFDPGASPFGIYSTGREHTIYSEDLWNILYNPDRATHAMRVYPVRDKNNIAIENTFLVCMEEDADGDYNDYVFLLKNVEPVFIQNQFQTILNGKNLQGWYSWLQGKGKNNDPNGIFTFDPDGVLHDLGKDLGYIMTEKSYGNFHFTLEFKWGERRWPPREANKRDSGICYNVPEDYKDQIWPPSVECQIQEGDVGDFWLLEYSTIQVDGKQNSPSNHTQIVKKKDGEKPTGEWNLVEVISFNGKCAHIVNGTLVNYGENSSLIGGRILIQSEYAELYYRNIRIREL